MRLPRRHGALFYREIGITLFDTLIRYAPLVFFNVGWLDGPHFVECNLYVSEVS